jgi:hypothetical protein
LREAKVITFIWPFPCGEFGEPKLRSSWLMNSNITAPTDEVFGTLSTDGLFTEKSPWTVAAAPHQPGYLTGK